MSWALMSSWRLISARSVFSGDDSTSVWLNPLTSKPGRIGPGFEELS